MLAKARVSLLLCHVLAVVLPCTERRELLSVLLRLVLSCSSPGRVFHEEAHNNGDYARDEMKDVVSCIDVREPEKQPIISPIRSCWKVKRGKEPQQSQEEVKDAKDSIEETCLSSESGGDTKQSCDEVENIVVTVYIEDAENCLYSSTIFLWGKEPDNTDDGKDDTKCECKHAICGPKCGRSLYHFALLGLRFYSETVWFYG